MSHLSKGASDLKIFQTNLYIINLIVFKNPISVKKHSTKVYKIIFALTWKVIRFNFKMYCQI